MSGSWPANLTGGQLRMLCRCGGWTHPTAGAALGYVQANLVLVPKSSAEDFAQFCELNPRPCPMLENLPAGDPESINCAPESDVRTDLPRYCILREGDVVERPTSIENHWQEADDRGDSLVTFLLGCSFSFERSLIDAGLPVRHVEERKNVPMYRTNICCKGVGRFSGPLVVSMRPMTPIQAQKAAAITARTPLAHGGPIQIGNEQELGINDLSRPDFGDSITIHDSEVPVFWACGVTPMVALMSARLPLAITHEPGHMFVTDLRDEELLDLDHL